MNGWLVAGTLLLATMALPAQAADSPVKKWQKGEKWTVQLEQMPMHSSSASTSWVPSYQLRFNVVESTGTEVRVEVTTEPQNRFQERLVLRYAPDGTMLSARVVDPKRVQDLGEAGGFGVFGMLGREAFMMTKAPEAPRDANSAGARAKMQRPVRVMLDEAGRSSQVWKMGERFWSQYETTAGAPQRATLMKAAER
jgi:hypothetical protein